MPRRQRIAPTDNWQQLELRFSDSTQRTYELIRPVVLFGQSPAERAEETATAERTVYRHVARFTAHGMLGLQPAGSTDPPHTFPPGLRQLIVDLKAEHPPLRVNEIMTICYVRTGRRPDAKTVKRVLGEPPSRSTCAVAFRPTTNLLIQSNAAKRCSITR